jgi:hypothetical protein
MAFDDHLVTKTVLASTAGVPDAVVTMRNIHERPLGPLALAQVRGVGGDLLYQKRRLQGTMSACPCCLTIPVLWVTSAGRKSSQAFELTGQNAEMHLRAKLAFERT